MSQQQGSSATKKSIVFNLFFFPLCVHISSRRSSYMHALITANLWHNEALLTQLKNYLLFFPTSCYKNAAQFYLFHETN